MIFKPYMLGKILKRQKTQTRRPIKEGETSCRYEAGKSYAIQPGRGKPSRGRIRVVAVRSEPLGAITDTDVIAEGFKDREAFYAYWKRLYGRVDLEQDVWVITFKLTEAIEQQPALFLHRNRTRGYTTNPSQKAEGEPEAVDDEALTRIREESERNYKITHAEEELRRQARSLSRRLREATLAKSREGKDIARQLEEIERKLSELEAA